MLSSSAAHGLGPLDEGVPRGARSVASFYDHVYIGTDDGRVCLVVAGAQQQAHLVAAGKPVVQLLALGEIGLVLALCNGAVESIDAQRMRPRPAAKLPIKNEVLGIVLNETPVPDFSVCAFSSHKAHLFRWAGDAYEPWKVINIPSPPLDAAWALHKLCVAMEDQITLLDIPSGRALKVHDNGRFLMIVDGLGIVINASGQPSGSTIVWSSPPLQTVCTLDFAVSVHDDGRRIQVHSTDPRGNLAESTTIDFPVVALVAPAPWNAFATRPSPSNDASHGNADANDQEPALEDLTAGGGVSMLTPSAVFNLGTISLRERMEQLFDEDDIAAAFRVYTERVLDPFDETRRTQNTDHTRVVERRLARQLSIGAQALQNPDAQAAHEDLVANFHLEAGVAMLRKARFAKAMQHFAYAKLDLREIIAHVPHLCPPHLDTYEPKRLRIPASDHATSSSSASSSLLHFARSTPSENDQENLHLALKAHLSAQREKALYTDPAIAAFVDFALFRLYLDPPHQDGDRDALHALCASTNNALEVDTCAQVLLDKHRYHAAALLYGNSAAQRREALQIWADLGAGQLNEAGVDGVQETITFLRAHQDPANLVWAFSPWVLEKDPEHAITIFTEAVPSEKNNLAPETVLDHLAKFDKSPRARLRLRYLDHLTRTVVGEQSRAFDLRAAEEYLRVLENCPAALREQVRTDFAAFIDRPETLTSRVEEPGAGHESTFEADLAARYIDNASIPDISLLPEKAALYAKCGWHNQALAILVKDLHDPEAAEAYCLRHLERILAKEKHEESSDELSRQPSSLQTQDKAQDNPFLELVCLYFEPALAEQHRADSLAILEKYGRFIDPSLVMSKLPADMRLSDLQTYLSVVFRANVQRLSHLRVEKNLRVAQNIKTLYHTTRTQRRNFGITSDTLCRVCNKQILTDPFAVDPSLRTVAHEACLAAIEN
ncbi:Transforming growth factor-beta receptor-associated protein 1 [Hondaea fermentalgiana]|uniref:Transforming growth factor-beta receptor-associated protein 1 n=1 Tax=Hondaea fermentalgiana TaxID=2315210 RepID=A0A2R5G4Z1_9STRA|nr:Transforming growth factor-beta receptor-associated protein 1 [Hondaea fermentalgiana]|eukprot:GBG26050.1 Transforming growth factor-beta receptor-associated protein 1 [Hondaea fermentalgiana]